MQLTAALYRNSTAYFSLLEQETWGLERSRLASRPAHDWLLVNFVKTGDPNQSALTPYQNSPHPEEGRSISDAKSKRVPHPTPNRSQCPTRFMSKYARGKHSRTGVIAAAEGRA